MPAQGFELTASLILVGIAPAATAAVRTISLTPPQPHLDSFGELTLIRPPPVIPSPNPIRLPTPEEPPILLLIRKDLRREPLLIPRDVVIRWRESGIIPFEVVGDAEAELADDGGPVASAVVVAG